MGGDWMLPVACVAVFLIAAVAFAIAKRRDKREALRKAEQEFEQDFAGMKRVLRAIDEAERRDAAELERIWEISR